MYISSNYGHLTHNRYLCNRKVQHTATHYTTNASEYSWRNSVTAMINSLNWPSLDSHCTYFKLIMFYKIINDLIVVPSISLTPMSTSTRHHSQRFRTPYSRINTYPFSFLSSTIKQAHKKVWNPRLQLG